MNSIATFLNYMATHVPWDTVGAYVAGSGLLSPLMAGVLKIVQRFRKLHDLTKVFLVFVGGTLMAGVHYVMTTPEAQPYVIYAQGLILVVVAQPFFYLVVKPAGKWLAQQLVIAAQIRTAKTAAESISGLPTPPANDFSQ